MVAAWDEWLGYVLLHRRVRSRNYGNLLQVRYATILAYEALCSDRRQVGGLSVNCLKNFLKVQAI